jgi:hypothetical protein
MTVATLCFISYTFALFVLSTIVVGPSSPALQRTMKSR